jgi:hypothetical protein
MAQLTALVLVIAFFGAVILYARFVFRRFGPQSPRRWPSGRPAILLVLAIALTAIVVVPAIILVIGYVLGASACGAAFSASDPWQCSPTGRLVCLVCILAAGLPLAALCLRFLFRMVMRSTSP